MAQIQVKFFTQQERYKVGESPFSVLGTTTGEQLSDLINKLLLEQDSKIEQDNHNFDFVVNGEFLRSALLEHIEEKGLSVESVLPVEYFEAQTAPSLQHTLSENDWISGVKVDDSYILTGSYDCSVNVWSKKTGEKLATGISHSEPVKSVVWLQQDDKGVKHLASSSQDQRLILWKYDTGKDSLRPKFVCKGHSRSVECLAVNHKHMKIASGSWDCTVKFWSSSLEMEKGTAEEEQYNSASNKKRAKLEKNGFSRAAHMTLSGHTEVVTGVVWIDENELCSASWDHTLRLWDASEGREKSQLRGSKAVLSVDYSHLNNMLVTGNTDRHVRLWDPRSSGSVVKCNLTSHHGWVTCAKWCATNPNLLASSSFDTVVKMWDIRSSKTPLFDLTAHTDRVMCLDWHKSKSIVSGGADCKVFTFSAQDGSVQQSL